MGEETSKSSKELKKYILIALSFVFILWLGVFVSNIWLLYYKAEFNGATLGDSFGIVNALFSGLAFALLIYTALMQKEELRLQRQELRDNREELKRSADAHKELVKLTTLQNRLMIEQNSFMMNVNLDKLHPEFWVNNVDLSGDTYTVIELVVKYRGLRVRSVSRDVEILTPGDFQSMLHPNQFLKIKFYAPMNEVDINYVSPTGKVYDQKLVLGLGGWKTHTPIQR